MVDHATLSRSVFNDLILPPANEYVRVGAVAHQVTSRFVCRGAPDAIADVFGIALPRKPRAVAASGERHALWLGPDEWLLIAEDAPATLGSALRTAMAGKGSIVDVSHRNEALRVIGAKAADVLAHGCPLDFEIGAFPAGTATRTLFGKAEVIIWRQADDIFHIEAWRSFMPYVVGLLTDVIKSTVALEKLRQPH